MGSESYINPYLESVNTLIREGRLHPNNIALQLVNDEEQRENQLKYHERHKKLTRTFRLWSASVVLFLVAAGYSYFIEESGWSFVLMLVCLGSAVMVHKAQIKIDKLCNQISRLSFPVDYTLLCNELGVTPEEMNDLAAIPQSKLLEAKAEEAIITSCLNVLIARRECVLAVRVAHDRLDHEGNQDYALDKLWAAQVTRQHAIGQHRATFDELSALKLLERREADYFTIAERSLTE